MKPNISSFLIVALYLCVIRCVKSEIIPFKDDVEPGQPFFVEIPKFNPKEVPHWSPGKGRNSIDSSRIALTNACDGDSMSCKGSVDFLIFMAPTDTGKRWIESWESGDMCCTQDLVDRGICGAKNLNSLYQPAEVSDAFLRTLTITGEDSITLDDDAALDVSITRHGLYVLVFAVCNPSSVSVHIEGVIESMNPYGYVPAASFYNFPFYGALSLAYMLFGLLWLITCSLHSEELIQLQFFITGGIALGMIETVLLYSHFYSWNETGTVSGSLFGVALMAGVTKRAASRVVVLLVSMGYGVVRQSIGVDMKRVLYLGAGYVVLSSVYTLGASIPSGGRYVGDPTYENLYSLVVMLLATVDTCFYMWIFSSLSNIIATLTVRKQSAKLALYLKFRSVLVVSMCCALFWAIYGAYLVGGDIAERNWHQRWTIDASSETIYFVLFVAIAVLWAPYRNNQRYVSYVELTPADNGDVVGGGNPAQYEEEDDLEAEYGGVMDEDDLDPFKGSGATDVAMAIQKKN